MGTRHEQGSLQQQESFQHHQHSLQQIPEEAYFTSGEIVKDDEEEDHGLSSSEEEENEESFINLMGSVSDSSQITHVLYNQSYGDFALHDEVHKLYAERTGQPLRQYGCDYSRHDPVLVSIYFEFKALGKPFDGKFSTIHVKAIPKAYEKFYEIEDIDGMESIRIDIPRFTIHRIQRLLQTSISSEHKLKTINSWVNAVDNIQSSL
jgi:hypothetical protein